MHPDPPEATSFPQPPSFFWLPIDDQRHAAGIQDRNQPPDTLITTLCRQQLTRTHVTDAEWRWPVCHECWSTAEAHIGLHTSSTEGQPDVSRADEPTTGIPNTDKPGWWVVPPWPVHASLCDVVSHFLFFAPRDNASITEKLAYYTGYLAAIDAAPRHEVKYHYGERWYEDLRDCIGRCVTIYQDERATEIQQTHRNLRSLWPTAQAAPTSQERAS